MASRLSGVTGRKVPSGQPVAILCCVSQQMSSEKAIEDGTSG
ncbi:Hypothetical protein PFR_J18_2260 [Propionibacterium freudenreichii]|nr:Hypothetical protein PFR_J18_2260 [Propionibacterium freudenreichii]